MRGYAAVGLDNPKCKENVGGTCRAAGVYDAAFVACSGRRIRPGILDTMKAYRHMPLFFADELEQMIPFDCVPVAVDLIEGAIPLPWYVHPDRAFYIFGAEDATLGDRVLSWCRDVVVIPTERCMNLAATVNVVLYDRLCKRYEVPGFTKRDRG